MLKEQLNNLLLKQECPKVNEKSKESVDVVLPSEAEKKAIEKME